MFESFSHRKVVAFQSPDSDVAMKYPPYKVGDGDDDLAGDNDEKEFMTLLV